MSQELYECPECNCKEIVYLKKEGETVCNGCGLVLDKEQVGEVVDKDDHGPYQNSWTHPKYRGSSIGFKEGTKQKEFSSKVRAEVIRWKRLGNLRTTSEDHFSSAMAIFRKITKQINMPEHIRIDAIRILKNSKKENMIRSRTTYEEMIGASIFLAYKINNVPKSIIELLKEIKISKRRLFRICRFLIIGLKIKIKTTFEAESFIPKLCSKVDVDEKIQARALEIISKFKKRIKTSGKNPKGIALAAIYIASKEKHKENPLEYRKVTQKELSAIGDVTEVTIRERYKEMKKVL